jgi:hypothetical protein
MPDRLTRSWNSVGAYGIPAGRQHDGPYVVDALARWLGSPLSTVYPGLPRPGRCA